MRRLVVFIAAASIALVGYLLGASVGSAATIERVKVTSFNEGFQDALCAPAEGTYEIQDGAGNVCAEFKTTK